MARVYQPCRGLVDALVAQGLRVWDSEREIRPGDNWVEAVEGALRNSRAVLLVVTPESAGSRWQAAEMGAALAMQKLVIPVIAAGTPREVIPGPLRLRQYIEMGDPEVAADEIARGLVTESKA